MLVNNGIRRTANDIAKSYINKLHKSKKCHMLQIISLVGQAEKTLIEGDVNNFEKLLHESWLEKKSLNSSIIISSIDEIYNNEINKGTLGGKLIGAGVGGLVLF